MNRNNKESFKDHSRFTRWVNDLDENDKSLNPMIRKRKWGLIVAFVFILFVLSFILFPTASLKTGAIDTPVTSQVNQNEKTTPVSAFELPVDSFENQLKFMLYERVLEKK